MKFRAVVSWIALFLVSLVFTVSCTPSQLTSNSINSSSTTTANTSVYVGFSAWPGWIPWQVAQAEDFFAANNVRVDLQWFDGYLDSINALAKGKLNANSQTLNDTISSLATGAEQVIVLVNDYSNGNDKIIVGEGINSVADLKGKKVAAEPGTVDHFLLLLGLQKAGLTQADIKFEPLETAEATEAFLAGEIDAVGVFAPFTTKALLRPGSKELFSSKDFPGAISDHLTVSRKMINERPQDVQALVNTWFATMKFINKKPEKSYEIMAERAGITVEEYKEYDAGTKIFSVEDNLKAFSSGNDRTSLNYTAKEISNFLVANDLIKTAPNLNKLFDDRFVKAYANSHHS